ncbi:MAG: SUMF1/EgtB/PvdO family nonheme iron enzyme [Myxococcaceae bacterium]|nr:SUMF1/EgtB/PvdO family nonheme iron enzyme [Myxococcaceae bacterium]
MKYWALLALIGSASCNCQPVGPADAGVRDASTDLMDAGTNTDSGTNSDAGIDAGEPVVGVPCRKAPPSPGALCVEGGPFLLSTWSTFRHVPIRYSGDGGVQSEPLVPWSLPPFWLDDAEVTVAEYKDAGFQPPTDCGGWLDYDIDDEPYRTVAQRPAPAVDGGSLDVPVVCVSRSEASAFCAKRGGRLPLVAEFFRAARALRPDTRRFPWGNDGVDPNDIIPMPEWREYVTVEVLGRQPRPGLGFVREATKGRGPAGHFGLSANASEFVSECGEELATLSPPGRRFRNDCRAIGFFGSPWSTRASLGFISAPALMVVSADTFIPFEVRYAGAHRQAAMELTSSWFGVRPGPTTSMNVNDFVSWYVGFRCAYDDL